MDEKTQFFWAIVGDSAPEPVAVSGADGQRVAYTIGCADPFPVDADDATIELIPHTKGVQFVSLDVPEPLKIPATPEQTRKRREESEKQLAKERRRGISHGYAGFGARARQKQ